MANNVSSCAEEDGDSVIGDRKKKNVDYKREILQ